MNWRRGAADGFTLIEVLVALLLLALGALGAGATMLTARRAGLQSALASHATQLAAQAGESMRANLPAMAAPDAVNPYLQLDYDVLAEGPPATAPSSDCSAGPCDSAALAATDLAALRRALYEQYPLGRIKICRDGAWWDPLAEALRWECDGAAGAPVVVKIGWRQVLSRPGLADGAGGEAGGEAGGDAAGGAPVLVAMPLDVRVQAGTP